MGLFDSLFGRLSPGKSWLAEETAAVDAIAGTAMSSLSLDEVFEQLAEGVQNLIPFERMSIGFVDTERGTFTEPHVYGFEVPGRQHGDASSLAGTAVGSAIESRAGVLAGDESPEVLVSRFPGMKPAVDSGIRSVLAVPMVSDDRVVGVLTLESIDASAHSERHLDLALRIAARISGPVANSQRYADLQRESEEHAALAEIGRIVGPTPDVREAYRGLGRIARGLIPFDRFAVVIVDRSAGKATYDYVQGVEIAGWGVGDTFTMAGTPVGAVARDRAGLIELASSPEELASKVPSEAPGTAVGYRSIMLVPVVSGEQVVAVFTFGSTKAEAYSSTDLSRAGKIAAQAAGAVASSVRRASQRREAEEEASLTEVARTMASARDIGDVYEGFAEKVRALIPSDLVIVALVDLKAHEIAISWVSRGGMASGPEVGATFPMGETVFQALVGTVLGLSERADSAEELSTRLPEWPFIGEAGVEVTSIGV